MMSDKAADGVARRTVLTGAGMGFAMASAKTIAAPSLGSPAPIDEGSAQGGHVSFPAIHAETERPDAPPPNQDPPSRRVGFAIMGLGRLALDNILPAFAQCRHARPVALVSGDPEKMKIVAAQYGIPPSACYDYATFDRVRDDAGIKVVYVVLPNALHRDAVVRAARAGKHVLCEKPMATSPDEARTMVDACAKAGTKLMIAYRCQFEIYNAALSERARAGELGHIQIIDAVNTQNQGDPAQWRQKKALAGGGSLPDVGLYCLNTARALLGEEPAEVHAAIHSPPNDPRFVEVESTVSFTLRFPSGAIANCASSYSTHEHRNFRVLGSQAIGEVENAFSYEGQQLRIFRRDGKAETNTEVTLGQKNQFSLEIDHMARCVREGTRPRTPGEEGLQDHVIMAAIYESARTGRPVKLAAPAQTDAFRGPMPADANA